MARTPYLDAPFGLISRPEPAPAPQFAPTLAPTVAPAPAPRPAPPRPVPVRMPSGMGFSPQPTASPMMRQLQEVMGSAPPSSSPVNPATPNADPENIRAWIKRVESNDNYIAKNPLPGSSASGAYQYTDATWNNFGGYPKAMLAPREVQDAKFMADLQGRLEQFDGDPYKAIAAHYLPVWADDPSKWTTKYKFNSGKSVAPILSYVQKVVQGTPLEAGLDEYIQAHQR